VIRVSGLKRNWGTFALSVDELVVPAGGHLSLLGPCGSGKTLLLETIAGHYRAQEGEIYIGGKRVDRLAPEKRGIGFIYQNIALFPHMSVEANIAFGLRYLGVPKAERARRTREIAERVGIGDLIGASDVARLSGGEAQKVALARTLVTNPKVLLLDEPLHSLDRPAREEMMALILEVTGLIGTTVIHVTHDFSEASAAAGTCAVLMDGKLVQSGATHSVFANPASRDVAAFLGAVNCWEAQIAGDGVRFLGADWPIRAPRGGDVLYACLRPEALFLGDAASAARCRFRAKLLELSDRTDYIRVTLQCAGERIVANAPRAEIASIAPATGSELDVGFHPSDVHFITE